MKQKFIELYNTYIKREGADKLLNYLTNQSDFFTAPASAMFHGSYKGGLVEHSINVYNCLKDYTSRDFIKSYGLAPSEETVAIVALLHDICKVNCYQEDTRNVKDKVTGQWSQVPFYKFDDPLPYGHGEKSIYMISAFMKLTREEAFAIRYHMGMYGTEDVRNVSKAFEIFPLGFALHTSDMEATVFIEGKKNG